jgi:hypothetical protein
MTRAATLVAVIVFSLVGPGWVVAAPPRQQLIRVNAASGKITARVPAGTTYGQLLTEPGRLYGVDTLNGVAAQLDPRTGSPLSLTGLGDAQHQGDAALTAGAIWFADAHPIGLTELCTDLFLHFSVAAPGGYPLFAVAGGERTLLISRTSSVGWLLQRIQLVSHGGAICPRFTAHVTAQARFGGYIETALSAPGGVYVVVDGACSGEDCTPTRTLVRLDARTLVRRDDQLFPMVDYQQPTSLVYGSGSLWVTTGRGVARVQVPSLRLRGEIQLPNMVTSELVFTRGVLWASDQFSGRLARIVGGAVRVFPVVASNAGQVRAIASSGDSIWVSVG